MTYEYGLWLKIKEKKKDLIFHLEPFGLKCFGLRCSDVTLKGAYRQKTAVARHMQSKRQKQCMFGSAGDKPWE